MPPQQMPSFLKANVSLGDLRLSGLAPKLPALGSLRGARRKSGTVVGLDIQPGYVAAAKAKMNGSLVIEQAASAPLDAETVREGEVMNEEALASALRELFGRSGLDRRVRIGVANQRTVMRMLEVPPFSDEKDLAAAVRSQAEDQMPMPLASAAIDFRPLGIIDTPAGARQRVLLVAAQLDTVRRLMGAVRAAGLQPEGIDLSAFALIRSLYGHLRPQAEGESAPRMLHLNIGGLTNMVIAEGLECRFTRVLGRGLEAIAAEVAERRSIPILQARELVQSVGAASAVKAAPTSPQGGSTLAMMGSHGDGSGAEALALQMERQRQENEAAALAAQQGIANEQVGVSESAALSEPPAAFQPVDLSAAGEPPAATGAPGAPVAGFQELPEGGDQGSAGALGAVELGYGAEHHGPYQGAPEAQPPAATSAPQEGPGFQQGYTQPAPESVSEPPLGAGDPALAGAGQPEPPLPAGAPSQPLADGIGLGGQLRVSEPPPLSPEQAEVRLILEAGVRSIAVDVRNSLDFVIAQEQGAPVELVVLSGPALDIPGFAELLETHIGLPVRAESVDGASVDAFGEVSPQYFAIAAGLSVEEVRA